VGVLSTIIQAPSKKKVDWVVSRDSRPSLPLARRLLFSSHSFPQKTTDSQVESTEVKMLTGNFVTVVLSDSLFTRQDHPVSYPTLREIARPLQSSTPHPFMENIEILSSQTKRKRMKMDEEWTWQYLSAMLLIG
jgi:hypothetical protein